MNTNRDDAIRVPWNTMWHAVVRFLAAPSCLVVYSALSSSLRRVARRNISRVAEAA
jgi:hypothetical protein